MSVYSGPCSKCGLDTDRSPDEATGSRTCQGCRDLYELCPECDGSGISNDLTCTVCEGEGEMLTEVLNAMMTQSSRNAALCHRQGCEVTATHASGYCSYQCEDLDELPQDQRKEGN